MLGLIGLMGALVAGVMVDSLIPPHQSDEDGPQDEGDDTPETASLQQDTTLLGGPDLTTAGMPQSDDTPDILPLGQMFEGADSDDLWAGGEGDDAISGAAGNDALAGRGGNDTIGGGTGQDALEAGSGDDLLFGDAGNDLLMGADGADRLQAGAGDDTLVGGEGDDSLWAEDGADSLMGGSGADWLAGGAGDDALEGGYGDDMLVGNAGADTLEGGAGNDTLWAQEDAESDFLNGGAGDDDLHLGVGDWGNGGEGADNFLLDDRTLSVGEVARITDYDPTQDRLVIFYDAAQNPNPELSLSAGDDGSFTILLNGAPLAQLTNGAMPDLSAVELRAG